MNIILNEKTSEIASLLHSLHYANNLSTLLDSLENENIVLDEDFKKDLFFIRDIEEINSDLKFFFGESQIWKSLIDTSKLWRLNYLLLDVIMELSPLAIKRRLYSKLNRQMEQDLDSNSEMIVRDNKEFFLYIKNLKLDEKEKWNLLCFIEDIEAYKIKFINLINTYLPIYIKLHKKYINEENQLFNRVRDCIADRGLDYIKELANRYVEVEDYKEIHITVSVFNTYNLNFAIEDDTVYLYIGLRYEEYINRYSNGNSLEESLLVFKNLSEKTRFDIAKFLLEGEHFGQEIAEKLQISTAAVSYQMNYLFSANLVKVRKEDRKVYYVLNRDTISKSIEFFKKEFNL